MDRDELSEAIAKARNEGSERRLDYFRPVSERIDYVAARETNIHGIFI